RDRDDVLMQSLVAARAGREKVSPSKREPPVAGVVATGHSALWTVVLDLERTLLKLLLAIGALPSEVVSERLLNVIAIVSGELDEGSVTGRPVRVVIPSLLHLVERRLRQKRGRNALAPFHRNHAGSSPLSAASTASTASRLTSDRSAPVGFSRSAMKRRIARW